MAIVDFLIFTPLLKMYEFIPQYRLRKDVRDLRQWDSSKPTLLTNINGIIYNIHKAKSPPKVKT